MAGRPVTVRQRLDGRIEILASGRKLSWEEIPGRPPRALPVAKPRKPGRPWAPSKDHPWKKPWKDWRPTEERREEVSV